MNSEGLGDMFEGDFADTCARKFPLMSMSRAEPETRKFYECSINQTVQILIQFIETFTLQLFNLIFCNLVCNKCLGFH